MQDYYTIFNIPSLSTLLELKRRALQQAVSALKHNDLKGEEAYSATAIRLQKQFELQPIVFGEPKITNDREVLNNLSPGQGLLGYSNKSYEVDIAYPFTGSSELLGHAPSSVQWGGNTRVYQPSYGRVVSVTVRVQRLEKDIVLNAAEEMMAATRSLAITNTVPATTWNAELVQEIETALLKRKSDLDVLYS